MKPGYYNLFIKAIAAISITIGLLVIIGWRADIQSIKSVFPGLPTMKLNAAICFIFSGISLLLLAKQNETNRLVQIFISLIVLVIAGISFTQDMFHFNTGIDEWLIKDTNVKLPGQGFPGRMAATTAFCFLLISVSFIAILSRKKSIQPAIQYTLHLVTLISFIAAIGYLYHIPTFYKLAFFSSMAVSTAVLFFLLSIAASLINYQLGITGLFAGSKIGSIMARKLFPLIAIIVIVLGFLRMVLHWKNMITEDFGIALFAIAFLLVSLFLISFTAKYLNKVDAKRSQAEESLKTINKNLEHLVDERTADIHQISERLFLAAKGSKIGIWDWDIINNKLNWDDKMYQLYGLSASTFSGAYLAWENSLHPDDKEAVKTAIANAIAGQKELDIEFRVVWPDNAVHYIQGNATVQRDKTGKATRMVGTNWDITEQKKHLELIEQNEQKFRGLLEAAPDAMVIVNSLGKIELINQQTEKMFGYTPDELIDNLVEILIPDGNREATAGILTSFSHKPTPGEMGEGKELFAKKKNGEQIPVEVSLSPLHTNEGILIIASIRDITNRKKAEQEIKNNEIKFRTILDAVGDNAWEHDFLTGKTIFAKTIKHLIGYNATEHADNKTLWWQNTHPDDKHILEDNDKKYKAGSKHQHVIEYRIYHKDGSLKWILDRGVVIEKDSNGLPLKIVGTHTDITERKNTEASLNTIQKQFKSFMEHIPAMTWIVDKNSVFQFTNKLYLETFYDQDIHSALHGKSFFELFPRDIAEQYKLNNDTVFATNNVLETIEPSVKKDGSKIVLKVFKFPMQINDHTTVLGGVAIDITDQVEAKENLKVLNEQLVASNKELEQFAYVASHDLQEPLRMVSSFMQLLDKKYKPQLDDTAKQYIHFAVDGAERMKVLILDLLAFSRIGTEKQLNESVDINKVIDEVKLNFVALIKDNAIKINSMALPVIQANKMQMVQLFQNLIGNAIKYRGERMPEIDIGCTAEAGKYNFYVKDNGIGIDSKYFEKIFIIFQRLHNKSEYSGTGVGLSICKKIVEKHGGTITLQSQLGKGSTFNFSIPKK